MAWRARFFSYHPIAIRDSHSIDSPLLSHKKTHMKNILVLTDFSINAQKGVLTGFKFARDHDAKLTILNAENGGTSIEINLKEHTISPEQIGDEVKSGQINEWIHLANTVSYGNLILVDKSLKEVLKTHLNLIEFDLLIMTGTGEGLSKEYWGSTTEMVVTEANIPVLVLNDEISNSSFKKIIYASSFNESERKCFHIMIDLIPISPDATIHFLSINTESYFTQPYPLMVEVMEDYKEMALPISSEIHFFRDYDVNKGIIQFAEELIPDLIAMTDKRKKPLKHLLFGHEAVRVASMSHFPVLVLDY